MRTPRDPQPAATPGPGPCRNDASQARVSGVARANTRVAEIRGKGREGSRAEEVREEEASDLLPPSCPASGSQNL